MTKSLSEPHAPTSRHASRAGARTLLSGLACTALLLTYAGFQWRTYLHHAQGRSGLSFYHHVSPGKAVCGGVDGDAISHAGYIGLKGDSDAHPKRSFFWYFEAEENMEDAPIILTIGGGPGTSGLMNPLFGQSPCLVTEDGLKGNVERWSERYNLIALDHPIDVGFSYGATVNNSLSAAEDVYDFLQKFFVLFPHLSGNQFYISGGSYGGIYVPNIASVIHTHNQEALTHANQHINLQALIVSNPLSDPLTHWAWLLHYRCVLHEVYDRPTCEAMYALLPPCIDAIRASFEDTTNREKRREALELCSQLNDGDTHGVVIEDIRQRCTLQPTPDNPIPCHGIFITAEEILNRESTRQAFDIPPNITFSTLNLAVGEEFMAEGDMMREHYLLYESLLADGIRLLHYIGAQDANCAWPGVFSMLKEIKSPFQDDFLAAKDVAWPSEQDKVGTVRAIGEGAGNMTYILVDEAGHFVVKDQKRVAKTIIERWIENEPWF